MRVLSNDISPFLLLVLYHRSMPDSDNTTHVCLLLGSKRIPGWFVKSLQELVDDQPIDISLVVLADEPDTNVDRGLFSDVKQKRTWLIVALLQKLFDILQNENPYGSLQRINQVDCIQNAPVHKTTMIRSGKYGYEFSEDTLALVAEKADVAVHFGIGILRGDILTTPPFGVIGFHHGDVREYRGGPPGFWEFVHGAEETGVTVQRFTETLDGGEILSFKSIEIDDTKCWKEVRERQYVASVDMLSEAVDNIKDPEYDPEVPSTLGRVYSPSDRDWRTTVRYIHRVFTSKIDT